MSGFSSIDNLMMNFGIAFDDRQQKVERFQNYLQLFEKILDQHKKEEKFQKLADQYADVLTHLDAYIRSKMVMDELRKTKPGLTFSGSQLMMDQLKTMNFDQSPEDLAQLYQQAVKANQFTIKQYYIDAEKLTQSLAKLEYMAAPLGVKVLRIVGGVIGFILGAVIGGIIFHIAFGGPLTPAGLAGGAIGLTGGGHFGMGIGVTIARDAVQIISGVGNIFGGRESVTKVQKQICDMRDHGSVFFKPRSVDDMGYYALVRNAAQEALEMVQEDAKNQIQLPVFEKFKMYMAR